MTPIRAQKIATMHRLKAEMKGKQSKSKQILQKMSMIKADSIKLRLSPTSIIELSKESLTSSSKNTHVTKL